MNGWIKISRDILDWQHYQEPSVLAVFIDLLLTASYEDSWFRGVRIKRGENVSSLRTMAARLGMSVNTVQTALKKLVDSGEITRVPYKHGIKTVIRNYDKFQDVSIDVSTRVSSGVSTSVSKFDTIKEVKNKEDNNSSREEVRAKLENETLNNSLWLEQTSMALRSTDILKIGMDVLNEWGLAKISLDRYDAQHLFNHIRKKLEIAKQQQRPSKAEEKADRKAELKQIIMNNLMQMQYDNTTEHKN